MYKKKLILPLWLCKDSFNFVQLQTFWWKIVFGTVGVVDRWGFDGAGDCSTSSPPPSLLPPPPSPPHHPIQTLLNWYWCFSSLPPITRLRESSAKFFSFPCKMYKLHIYINTFMAVLFLNFLGYRRINAQQAQFDLRFSWGSVHCSIWTGRSKVKYGVRSPKFIWASCAQLYSLAETSELLTSPRIWALIRERYWPAKMDDISL